MIIERRRPRNRLRKNQNIKTLFCKPAAYAVASAGGSSLDGAPADRTARIVEKSILDINNHPIWSGQVEGAPVPRERARRVAVVRGLACVVASPAAAAWCRTALRQLSGRRPTRPIGGPLALDCEVRQDPGDGEVDEALITEILERAGIIAAGDRQLRVRRMVRIDDAANPRLTLTLRPAPASPAGAVR